MAPVPERVEEEQQQFIKLQAVDPRQHMALTALIALPTRPILRSSFRAWSPELLRLLRSENKAGSAHITDVSRCMTPLGA